MNSTVSRLQLFLVRQILKGRGTHLDIVPVKVFTEKETIQTYALLDSRV